MGLSPTQIYNVEFTVSDVGDASWDSGVFIEGLVANNGSNPLQPLLPENPIVTNPEEPPAWIFPEVPVVGGEVTFWDPWVATGYIYSVSDPAGPLFATYQAPDLGFDDTYELYGCPAMTTCSVADDFNIKLSDITANIPYTFTTPVDTFLIKGIGTLASSPYGLDPANTNAFVAGISFDKSGNVNVSQQPISSYVPGPLPLAGLGCGFAWSRKLRKRIKYAYA